MGDRFIDIDKCLKKVECVVKNKCEFISNLFDDGIGCWEKFIILFGYYEVVEWFGIFMILIVSCFSLIGGCFIVMSVSLIGGWLILVRMLLFVSGKVMQYDGVGFCGQDYEVKDFSGFCWMLLFSKYCYNEVEYIMSYD